VRPSRHRILAAIATLALLGSAAACGSDKTDSAAGGSTSAGKATSSKTKKKPAVDSCTLLKKDEIEGIIGANNGGQHGGGVGESVCEWDNEDNYHSVTVSIGSPKTAKDGKLPAEEAVPGAGTTEAGPDGIRFSSDNTATFAIADRACYVQVVTDPTSNKDRDTAVRLIKLIRARTSGKL
jgi:hypothetical protein